MIAYRTTTHPHGKLVTNLQKTLAFVRISKCASTTVVRRHNLCVWDSFEAHQDTFLTFCAVRDPYFRFLSSIPETLCRICSETDPSTHHSFSDVFVSNEILTYLSERIDKSGSLIQAFIDCIYSYGFFDAHHEPMTNFLYGQDGQQQINPIMICVKEVDLMSRFLYSISGQYDSKSILVSNNVNLPNSGVFKSLSSFRRQSHPSVFGLGSVVDLVKPRQSMKSYLKTFQVISTIKSMPTHPLKRFVHFYPNRTASWQGLKSIIYAQIKEESNNFPIDSFMHHFYKNDRKLFSAVSQISQILNLKNFLTAAKRLQYYDL